MKLKKLDLVGFKSFYDKTSFEFSDGITGIVGPNGCGKSNIVDAVRWVLGEHAPSYLRSKALQDVIFAGSEAAGPLGMAEVTLTFANEDGAGPPGFESYAEIQVTRRAYRDGESEFLINKVPCRLKDIAELFLDTGAGARGYAIIEQGKIANIVKARPEEKRLIVEEAAGVAKFRVRRKEAERKMESTRQNLARVRDVLDEVRRQLGSLERQVRKAERFRALRDELRDLDARIASSRHAELSAAIESLRRELDGLEGGLASARADIAAREADRETERVRQAGIAASLQELRDAHDARKTAATRLQAAWEGKGKESESLGERIREADAETAALGEEIEELAVRLEAAGAALSEKRNALAAGAAAMADAREEAERSRTDHQRAKRESEQAQNDLSVRVAHHSQAASSTLSLRTRIEEAGRNLERQGDRLSEAIARSERADAELREAEAREAEARESFGGAVLDVERDGAGLAGTVARLESLLEERRDVEGRLKAAQSRNETLLRLFDGKEWASTGARAVLLHYNGGASGNGDRGILGLIGELVETDAVYEKAVEAVLGERMQSVVVRGHVEGLAAMRYLKDTGEGRGAFVPMTIRPREDAAAYAGEDGVIAPLTDVVTVAPVCGDLGRKLFGGTLLVKDLECALRLWNRNGVWNSYVTLEGEMVTADGVLVGGSQGDAGTGVLAVRREIREVEKEIASLSAESVRMEEAERGIRREKAEAEDRIAEGMRTRESLQAALAAAEQRRAVLESALGKARETVESLTLERDFYAGEIRRMEEEFEGSERQAQEIGEARGQEEDRVRLLAASLEAAEGRMSEALAAAHAAEVAWTQLDAEVRAEERRLEEASAAQAGKRQAMADRAARRADFLERVGILAAEMAADRDAIDEALAELAKGQDVIDGLLSEHAVLSDRISAMESALRDARAREFSVSESLSGARLEMQRLRMEIANLDDLHYQKYEVHPADIPAASPPEEGGDPADTLEAWEFRAREVRERMTAIGDVNMGALEESRELSERHAFLTAQKDDLEKSLEDLARAIQKINRTTREKFSEAMDRINEKLLEVFPRLFNGGRACLTLTDEENLLESGVELVVQLPGKKLLPLDALSGGEKSLAAAALIFSIFLVKPSPFCLLDEADAALDDSNTDRVNALIRSMADRYQFLLITHNKRTMELADLLYGITMEKPGISKVVSVRFQS